MQSNKLFSNTKITKFVIFVPCRSVPGHLNKTSKTAQEQIIFVAEKIVPITKVTKYVIFVSVKMQQEQTKKTAQQQFKNKNYKFCNFCCSHTD